MDRITHLHLWQVKNLDELLAKVGNKWPVDLKCLDLRGCRRLRTLPELPGDLEELILWNNDGLELGPEREDRGFGVLVDLSLMGGLSIHESWLRRVMKEAPLTRLLEIEGCKSLEDIEEDWPTGAVDIRLNHNENLTILPEGWPKSLRRLELSDSRISSLDELPPTIDYLNVTGMRKLRTLPSGWKRARTLFLYGSGLLEPPVSEHGEASDQNVAADTLDYFHEREALGDGHVRRCKVLVLGNGEAGKTCFSLGLVGRDTRGTETTPGIQFHEHRLRVPIEEGTQTRMKEVPVHIWDFGGQEIYHDVHRLFMEAGSVFVVLWDPEQDGREGPNRNPLKDSRYEDKWRPLKYWFDLIYAVCPHDPKILIVCSHHRVTDHELRQKLQEQLQNPAYLKQAELVSVDSCPDEDRKLEGKVLPKGELDARDKWLKNSVGEVISTQGTVVCSYWEIAQRMVEDWIRRMTDDDEGDRGFEREFRQITMDTFRAELLVKIREQCDDFPKLTKALNANAFELNDRRVKRTLRFLTRTGSLYWNEKLREERIIVGQRWALDGIYSLLSREASFYNDLKGREGRFDEDYFRNTVLANGDYTDEEKGLLLSFMLRFGYLLQIQDADKIWWAHDSEYLSVMHLTDVSSKVLNHYDSAPEALQENRRTFESPVFHRANWCGILGSLAEKYGKKAHYYQDAFILDREEGEDIYIFVEYDKSGLGAKLTLGVRGARAGEELDELSDWLKSWFPEVRKTPTADPPVDLQKDMEVFLSYTWDPQTEEAVKRYEVPVDAIDAMLQEMEGVKPIRDRREKEGESITEFMKNAASHCELFIMIHSDKYWKSPNCLYEVKCLNDSFVDKRETTFKNVIIGVEHVPDDDEVEEVFRKYGLTKTPDPGTNEVGPVKHLLCFWEETPPLSGTKYEGEGLAAHAKVLIPDFLRRLDDRLEVNHKWKYGSDKVLDYIRNRVLEKLAEFRRRTDKRE